MPSYNPNNQGQVEKHTQNPIHFKRIGALGLHINSDIHIYFSSYSLMANNFGPKVNTCTLLSGKLSVSLLQY